MERKTRLTWRTALVLLLILCCGFVRPASSAIVYVNTNATGTVHDGRSWATAFTDVQPAIGAAKSGDEVWVAAGSYGPVVLLEAIGLYGGFAGTEATRSQRDWKANVTVLDANVPSKPSTPTSVVVLAMYPPGTVVIDGFTIRNGTGTKFLTYSYFAHGQYHRSFSTCGGGIVVVSTAPVTISNNTFQNNVLASYGDWLNSVSQGYGGAIGSRTDYYVQDDWPFPEPTEKLTSVHVVGNTFDGNGGGDGGAIGFKDGADIQISGNTFRNNSAKRGGAVYGLVCALSGNQFVGNRAYATSGLTVGEGYYYAWTNPGQGGAVNCSGTFTDNTFTSNTVTGFGGAVSCGNSTFLRNRFIGNSALSYTLKETNKPDVIAPGIGGAVNLAATDTAGVVEDNVFAGNSATGKGGGISVSLGTGLPAGTVAGFRSIANNTVVGNTAGPGLGVITAGSDVPAGIANNIVALNSAGIEGVGANITLSHNDVWNNVGADYLGTLSGASATTDIAKDPLFPIGANGDFHLLPGSPCIDAGDDLAVSPGTTDIDHNPRIRGLHVDIGAYESAPQIPWSISLGSTISGGLTVSEGVAYVTGTDGNLYARSTEDGSVIAGSPVDINAAVGAPVKLPSRPAVYYGKTGKAIYLTTDRGDVLRILPNGTVAWHVRPLAGQTVSTPAVTPDGCVFVNLSTGNGPFNNYVFKLDEATGTPLSLSPFLGYTNANDLGDFSPAANHRYLYVNSGWGSGNGLSLLNQDNLAVRSSFAGGEQCLSPLLVGSDLILATRGGKVYKMNAVTMNPDLGFGHFGVADIGTQISAAPFADASGNVYIGTADGRIMKWSPGSGSFLPFYTTTSRIAGLTINRAAGVLGFGTSSGTFAQVPLDNPTAATTVSPGGPVSTGTVYETVSDRFIVVTDNGILSGYPSVN